MSQLKIDNTNFQILLLWFLLTVIQGMRAMCSDALLLLFMWLLFIHVPFFWTPGSEVLPAAMHEEKQAGRQECARQESFERQKATVGGTQDLSLIHI